MLIAAEKIKFFKMLPFRLQPTENLITDYAESGKPLNIYIYKHTYNYIYIYIYIFIYIYIYIYNISIIM